MRRGGLLSLLVAVEPLVGFDCLESGVGFGEVDVLVVVVVGGTVKAFLLVYGVFSLGRRDLNARITS